MDRGHGRQDVCHPSEQLSGWRDGWYAEICSAEVREVAGVDWRDLQSLIEGEAIIDAASGEIVAFDLTDKDVDDASHVSTLLEQLKRAPASFMARWRTRQATTYDAILARNPFARFVVPPCRGAVPGPTATISPSQRDLHILALDEHGRMSWQKASGYNQRSKVEATVSRYKRVIDDTLKFQHDARRTIEVAIAIKSLNRMNELGQAQFVRSA
jgi:hypothetical protein